MLEVWPSHGQDRGRLRPTPEKMPALRQQSRIGDYRACDSIQGRGLVRDGLRREKNKCRDGDKADKPATETKEAAGKEKDTAAKETATKETTSSESKEKKPAKKK